LPPWSQSGTAAHSDLIRARNDARFMTEKRSTKAIETGQNSRRDYLALQSESARFPIARSDKHLRQFQGVPQGVPLGVRRVSAPGHPGCFLSVFVSCFPAPTWGLQGALVVASSTPCPSAFRGPPLVPRGATTLARLAKPEGQGVRPLQPHESSPLWLRRFVRRSAAAPRRQVAPPLFLCLFVVCCFHAKFPDVKC